MNVTSLYMNTCRLVMQVDVKTEDTVRELNNLLPYLRQSLACIICRKILISPCSSSLKTCTHYVCKMCVEVHKLSKMSCSGCNNHHGQIQMYSENIQVQLILKCYKKLCSYIKNSNLYAQLLSVKTNGNYCSLGTSLADIIDEALNDRTVSVSLPSNVSEINSLPSPRETDSDELDPDSYSSDITDNDDDKVVTSTTVSDEGIDITSGLPPDQSSMDDYCTNSEDNMEIKSNDFIKKEEIEFEENEEARIDFSKSYSHEISHCDSPLLTVDSSDIAPMVEIPISSHLAQSQLPLVVKSYSPSLSIEDLDEELVSSNDTIDLFEVASAQDLDKGPESILKTEVIGNPNEYSLANNSLVKDMISIPSSSMHMENLPSVSNNFSRDYNGVNVTKSSRLIVGNNINDGSSDNRMNINVQFSSANKVSPIVTSMNSHQSSNSVNEVNNLNINCNSFNSTTSVMNSLLPSLDLTNIPNVTNCIFNIQAGTLLRNVKPGVRENLLKPNPIHGTGTNSSVYSVMYNNNESTKITIKRKPPDLENVNKLHFEPDKVIPNPQNILKKAKAKPKPKPKRKGCRCGNATPTPGKLTCCGQRCPCYVEAKACLECQCRGCRNPHRPGGKKVRPVIPQLGNIQIHQVQPMHQKLQVNSSMCNTGNSIQQVNSNSLSSATPILTSGGLPIRSVHTVHGISQLHSVPASMHQLINIGSNMIDSSSRPLQTGIPSNMTLKPVNLALSSLPTQLLINDEKSTSISDNSDIDIDF